MATDDTLPILWGARTGNCIRAAIGLIEAGIPFATRRLELRQNEQRSAAFLALNPFGKTPVLTGLTPEGQPFSLTQSNAILFFADELNPGSLIPLNGRARIRTIERFFYFVTDVIGLAFAASALVRSKQPKSAQFLTELSLAAIVEAERYLDEGPFIAGDAFSIADIAAYTMIRGSANHLPWDKLSQTQAWMARVGKRPSIANGWDIF